MKNKRHCERERSKPGFNAPLKRFIKYIYMLLNDGIKTWFASLALAMTFFSKQPRRFDCRGFAFFQPRMKGFTLLEILIALFIFSILSLMLATGLRTVINAQSGTESKAELLRKLQIALLVMSRDVEQAVNRPVMSSSGKEEPAFIGKHHHFIFTHTGFANPTGALARSTLQRTGYTWNEKILNRMTWAVLDQAPQSKAHMRPLLTNVTEAHFQYLDHKGRFRDNWPLEGEDNQPLPRGVKVYVTLAQWGSITQLYLIAAQPSKIKNLATKPGSLPNEESSKEQKKQDE
jgi:general secretion pathway protein J